MANFTIFLNDGSDVNYCCNSEKNLRRSSTPGELEVFEKVLENEELTAKYIFFKAKNYHGLDTGSGFIPFHAITRVLKN